MAPPAKKLSDPGPVSDSCTKQVVRVLSRIELCSINFQYRSLCVTWVRYTVVRDMVSKGRIKCYVGVGQQFVEDGFIADAKYIPNIGNEENLPANEFRFPKENFGTEAPDECDIVHEATHAMFDIYMAKQTALAADNECVAYLAEAIFSIKSGKKMRSTMEMKGVGESALALADKIIKSGITRTYVVTDDEMAALNIAVRNDYGYIKKGDSDKTNALSIFDGV